MIYSWKTEKQFLRHNGRHRCLPQESCRHSHWQQGSRKHSGEVVTEGYKGQNTLAWRGPNSLGLIECNDPSLLRNKPEKRSLFASLALKRETDSLSLILMPFPHLCPHLCSSVCVCMCVPTSCCIYHWRPKPGSPA